MQSLFTWVGRIATALLIVLVALIAINVILRYAFNASSLGLEELNWHIYASVFLLAIPYALTTSSHVRVDIFYTRLKPHQQAKIDLVGAVIALIPISLIVMYSGWQFTLASYSFGHQPSGIGEFFQMLVNEGIGEKSQDPGGLLNRWIIKGMIPLSFTLMLMASIGFMIEKINIIKSELGK